MTTAQQLIPIAQFTHKLVYEDKTESEPGLPCWKTKLLTAKQARFLEDTINGREQFIVLMGQIFPKYGSYVKKLTPEELDNIQVKYQQKHTQKRLDYQEQQLRTQRTEEIDLWIKNHSADWKKIFRNAEKETKKKFTTTSERLFTLLVHGYARKEVEILLRNNSLKKKA